MSTLRSSTDVHTDRHSEPKPNGTSNASTDSTAIHYSAVIISDFRPIDSYAIASTDPEAIDSYAIASADPEPIDSDTLWFTDCTALDSYANVGPNPRSEPLPNF